MQINGGLNYLFGVPNNKLIQGIIILIVTVLFLISAWSGLSKGIQYLSNLNMLLAAMLLIIILIVGPTILIMNMFTSSIGEYLNTLIFNSFDVAPLNSQKHEWLQSWTIYYWGWWMSWSPFVGIFIARLSKGRSIREFVIAVLGVLQLLVCYGLQPSVLLVLKLVSNLNISLVCHLKHNYLVFSMRCLWVQFYRLSLLS